MAIPVIKGEKTAFERFPGADATYCIEAMMQDRKALQSGTSHFLGRNFARAQEIKFLSAAGVEEYAWTTSWGVSTRLIGALIMAHSDDNGLVLPPRLAPTQVVVLPVIHGDEGSGEVTAYCENLVKQLREVTYRGRPLEVVFDTREGRGGDKTWSWIKKGVPLWVEVGPRDIASDAVFAARRDKERFGKWSVPRQEFVSSVPAILDEIQAGLLARARAFRDAHTVRIDTRDEFYEYFTPKNPEKPEIHGGFALCHWSGEPDVEERVRDDLAVTVRCIPLDAPEEAGRCVIGGKPSSRRVIFAKAY